MTHEEVVRLLRVTCAAYPNFKPADMRDTVEVWEMMLGEYPYELAAIGLKTFISTSKTGFAPTIGELIGQILDLTMKANNGSEQISANEAWSLVMKAVRRGTYYSQEDFNRLPELAKKAIGSADQIRLMAQDTSFNEGVQKSLFLKAYDRALSDAKSYAALPNEVKQILEVGVNGTVRIGDPNVVS